MRYSTCLRRQEHKSTNRLSLSKSQPVRPPPRRAFFITDCCDFADGTDGLCIVKPIVILNLFQDLEGGRPPFFLSLRGSPSEGFRGATAAISFRWATISSRRCTVLEHQWSLCYFLKGQKVTKKPWKIPRCCSIETPKQPSFSTSNASTASFPGIFHLVAIIQ